MIAIIETNLSDPKELSRSISLILSEPTNLAHNFSKDVVNTLPEYKNPNWCLETTNTPLFKPLYNYSQNELKILWEYIVDNLAKKFIQLFNSLAMTPILFVKKRDENLCLYIDYRGLNLITKKNHYPLPQISKALDRFVLAKMFTKLDI